jgi:methyl coenzyme M reductase gamma subunit
MTRSKVKKYQKRRLTRVRNDGFFFKTVNRSLKKKKKDEIGMKKKNTRENILENIKNGKRSVCEPLKVSFTVYRDVKRESCSISVDSSILV